MPTLLTFRNQKKLKVQKMLLLKVQIGKSDLSVEKYKDKNTYRMAEWRSETCSMPWNQSQSDSAKP